MHRWTRASSDDCYYSVFAKAHSPLVVHPLSFHGVASTQLVLPAASAQPLCCGPYERDPLGINHEHLLNRTFKNCKLGFFLKNCRLEFDVYFTKHYNFVADDKGQPNVFDESVATVFLSFETVLKASGRVAFNLLEHTASCCFLHSEALSVLLLRFQVFRIVLSMKLFEG